LLIEDAVELSLLFISPSSESALYSDSLSEGDFLEDYGELYNSFKTADFPKGSSFSVSFEIIFFPGNPSYILLGDLASNLDKDDGFVVLRSVFGLFKLKVCIFSRE
jgi:hypothetical protein